MAVFAVGLLFAVYAVISTQREADRRRGRGMQLRGRDERDHSAEWKDVGQRRRPGCIIVTIPPRPASPTLTAAWGSGRILILHVASSNNLGTVQLRAVGRMRRGTKLLAIWNGDPDSRGKLNVTLPVPVAANVGTVCAEARFPQAAEKVRAFACLLHVRAAAAAEVQLAVPSAKRG